MKLLALALLLGTSSVYGGYGDYDSSSKVYSKPKEKKCNVGAINMFYGDDYMIPRGFQICDGSNTTPDLRDRFPVGAGQQFPYGNTGGGAYTYLSVDQMPEHGHKLKDVKVSYDGIHKHDASGSVTNEG
eukprot:459658_1